MADSRITVSGLQATGGTNQILLSWDPPNDPNRDGLPYLQFDVVEIHYGTSNNRDAAQLLGESEDNNFIHTGIAAETAYYYWIRPRDQSGLYGDWYPAASDNGVVGSESSASGGAGQGGVYFEEYGLDVSATTADGAGYIVRVFQRQFTAVYGVHAMAVTGLANKDMVGGISVSLLELTTDSVTLRTFSPDAPISDISVYWRVFGL